MSKRKAKDIALGDFEKGGTVGTTCTLRIIIIPVNILFGEGNGNLLSSILAWEIPWTEELGRLYSPWGPKRVGHNLETKQQQTFFFFLCFVNFCSTWSTYKIVIIIFLIFILSWNFCVKGTITTQHSSVASYLAND